jgi:hypothetical protein
MRVFKPLEPLTLLSQWGIEDNMLRDISSPASPTLYSRETAWNYIDSPYKGREHFPERSGMSQGMSSRSQPA